VRIIGKGSVRLAVDSVGGDATATLVQLLSDRGVLVTYSAASGRPLAVNALFLIGKHLTVKGFFLGDFDHVSKVLPAQIEAAPLVALRCAARPRRRGLSHVENQGSRHSSAQRR